MAAIALPCCVPSLLCFMWCWSQRCAIISSSGACSPLSSSTRPCTLWSLRPCAYSSPSWTRTAHEDHELQTLLTLLSLVSSPKLSLRNSGMWKYAAH
ncbi:hypothetical protein AOLI_G00060690 [Acnodon oligacanthus]